MNNLNSKNQIIDCCKTINLLRPIRKCAALMGLPLMSAFSFILPQPALAQYSTAVSLADQPIFTSNIPGNLAIILSNEYPTNEDDANWGNYSDNVNYAGYFDPNKCYVYQLNTNQAGQSYFRPVTHAGGPNKHFCDISSLKSATPPSDTSTFTSKTGSSGLWSGNFLNWSTMQSIDPVRAVLTGGYRVVDRASVNDPMPDGTVGSGPLTVLEKAWNGYWYVGKPASQMRGTQLIQSWWSDYAVQYTLPAALVGNLTPFGAWINGTWKRNATGNTPSTSSPTVSGGFYTFIKGMGNRMEISPVDSTLWYPLDLPVLWNPNDSAGISSSDLDLMNVGTDNTGSNNIGSSYYQYVQPPASWTFGSSKPPNQPSYCSNGINPYPCYQVYVRVSVCDDSTGLDSQSLLESNCVSYSSPSLHYKPEGLVQKYANQLRYSVFSYPWNWNNLGNTALLRSPMRFIGPTVPDSNPAVAPSDNSVKEWDPDTGVMYIDPDPTLGSTIPAGGQVASLTNTQSPLSWPTKTSAYNLYHPMDGKVQSGFLNFINKYGEYYGYSLDEGYKIYDNIDDLYYAALRYYRNQQNPWNMSGPVSGFPIDNSANAFPFVKTWTDPILYRCQKNFILGLSDDHTWNGEGNINDIPNIDSSQVSSSNDVNTWVNRVGSMEGISNSSVWPANAGNKPSAAWPRWDGNGTMGTLGSYYTAGMAYYMHVSDIRPDLPALGKINGKTTVDTYWVDMTEFNAIEHLSPYILAAKYGGFNVPDGYDPSSTTPLTQSWWNTTGDTMLTHLRGDPTSYTGGVLSGTTVTDPVEGTPVPCGTNVVSSWVTVNNGHYPRPDNFFTAADSAQMTASFQKAFSNMVSAIKAYTTAFSLISSSVAGSGSASYASQYSSTDWTSTMIASNLTITPGTANTDATVSLGQVWNTDGVLSSQLLTQPATDVDNGTTITTQPAYYGWDTNRRVATWNGSQGVPFRWNNLTAAQQSALYPLSYAGQSINLPGGGADYVDYLRGDRTNEVNANITGGANVLRRRDLLLGDIVDSKLTEVGSPQMLFSDNYNPGYAAFKTGPAASRTPMVYAGANDGMMHAFNGDLTPGGAGGTEMFAYVPSAMFQTLPAGAPGGNSTAPNDLLAWLGNPNYVHHFSVDATPLAFDVDFDRAGSANAITGTPDWHTVLIGGLGKGGNGFYALDVTDPGSMAASESVTASKVLWEFSAPDMGYSYGAPIVVKTAQYGWVVALTSGYDNADGYGHLYLLNPKTGQLLQEISTPLSSNGLAQASAYVADYTNYTADAIYAGDLNGQLWRFDLTGSSTAPTLLAKLTDASGAAQPVTTAPLIEIAPATGKRFVLLGTGRLLNVSDIQSTQVQDFYAIIDGNANAFSAVSSPITRGNLTQLTDLTVPVTLPPASEGWYLDLDSPNYSYIPPGSTAQATTSATGERVVTPASAYNGQVAFSSELMTPDSCLPNVGNIYVINFATGQTSLSNNVTDLPQVSVITDMHFVSASDGSVQLLAGNQQGGVSVIPFVPASDLGTATRLLNWRNVPVNGN